MITYLDLVNAVLRRLREDEVASIEATSYSKLIRDFVKEAVQEVEGTRNWNALRQTLTVQTVAGTYNYALEDVPPEYTIMYVHMEGDDYDLIKAYSSNWMTHQYLTDETQASPRYYDINGVSANGEPLFNVYPIPDAAYSIYVNLKMRTTDSPSDTTVIYLPERPVILRAFQFALEERGDSGSDSLVLIEERYRSALSTAAEHDMLLNEDETTWVEE